MPDPSARAAADAWRLAARIELDRSLGIDFAARPPEDAPAEPPAPEERRAEPAPAPARGNPPAAADETPPPAPPRRVSTAPAARRPANGLMPPEPPEPDDPELARAKARALECAGCGLAKTRLHVAFGEGAAPTELMFVGEGPGREEDETGRPFVGPAGRLLTGIIERGLETPRAEVYIANIVKCRPPGNRDPHPDEVVACAGFLRTQIERVRPKIIVAVGKPAANTLLENQSTLGALRGRWHEWRGIPVRVIYHPSYLLRERAANGGRHTEADRRTWEDLKAIKARLAAMAGETSEPHA